MKFAAIQSFAISAGLLLGASLCDASVLTVGPTGQYATPCPAIKAAAPGDTIQVDANNGVPYFEPADATTRNRSDCVFFTNNLTIVGVNGRPVLDAAGLIIEKSIFDVYGHDIVIDNFEMRNAATVPGTGDNGAGVRIESGNATTPGGGNVTIRHSYIHDNQDGVLTANVGPGTGGGGPDGQYFSANPFITLEYDEFARNGVGGDGHTHNMYIGFGGNLNFTLQYSWSHDSYLGHTVKSRAPINNILYNLITDQLGATSYMLDFPLGGSTYVVGNSIYKTAVTNSGANKSWMMWRDVGDTGTSDPDYNTPNEDLHFTNNTVVLDSSSNSPAFVIVSCSNADANTCAAPPSPGLVLSVNAVVQNNIFVGPPTLTSNQATAVASNNLVVANTPANLAALFVDWAHFNFHLVSGAAAIGTGLYPPTDNTGAADPKALAVYEYIQPISRVARPTPTGTHMDEGAYSYPRADTPPSPSLSYTTSVTTPGTGTITLTGLPTPSAGQYNNAAFTSGNPALISAIAPVSSSTSTITATFRACCAASTTVVPIDIYVDGAHLVANVSVVPGPVALQSITLDTASYPKTTVHLTNASTSPVVVNLSTTDSSILYVPASITIPAGQLSAETGSETGSLWGQTPASKAATITATYAGANVSLPVTVYAPYVNHFYCNVYPCNIIGGQAIHDFQVAIAGDYPTAGGPITFTSNTPSVIPNQTFQAPGGNFYSGFVLTTNNVSNNTTVTLSISVNGSTKLPNQSVLITPASGTNVAASSGAGQAAAVGSNFSNPIVALVQNGSTPVSGATVTFGGTGVSFPNGATAVTNSSGLAAVTARATTTGALMVTASTAGASTPASFPETGTAAGTGGTTILAINSGGPVVGSYVADEFFTGGTAANTTNAINTSLVSNPAPQAVYQTWRYGTFSYAIPGLTAGGNYTVRLHFAEALKTAAGQRVFNVAINNSTVLSNFDIFATAGGANTAITESFAATADASGQISIQASVGTAGNPEIGAIEIQSSATAPTVTSITRDGVYSAGTTVNISAAATSPVVVNLSSSDATVLYVPATVTIPTGQSSAETGSMIGSLWGQSPSSKTATITATYGGTSKTYSDSWHTPGIHGSYCNASPCTVKGGNSTTITFQPNFGGSPYGGSTVQITSDNSAIIPNQTYSMAAGVGYVGDLPVTTKTAATTTTINVTFTFNGDTTVVPIQVTP